MGESGLVGIGEGRVEITSSNRSALALMKRQVDRSGISCEVIGNEGIN